MGDARLITDRFWDIVESGDLDRLPEVWTDDTEFSMPGAQLRGIDAMKELCEWWTAFPDLRHEVQGAVECGKIVSLHAYPDMMGLMAQIT